MIVRSSILFVVVGLLAAAALYDQVDEPSAVAAAAEEPIVTPSVSDPPRLDGAWYCPTGSSSPTGFADHQVQVANLSSEPSVATVSILTGGGPGPTLRVELAPFASQEVSLSSIAEADAAGAVVEMVGGTGVVAHTLETNQGQVAGSCATHVSSSWYFASGRTTRDSREIITLMNPFPEDVVFNVELHRSAGRPRRPAELQGGVVAANSVKTIELESYVAREDVVAAAITTVRGRLVAERLQLLNGELGPSGGSLQLGVTAPARSWMLAAGRIHDTGDDRVIVFNPSAEETANVNIELWPLNPTDRSLYGLGAIPRELLPGRFEVLDLRVEADRYGLRLPFDVGVSVTASNGVPIVAERWQFGTAVDTSLIGAGGTEVAPGEETADGGEAGEPAEDGGETADGGDGETADGADGETADGSATDGEADAGDADAGDEPDADAGAVDVDGDGSGGEVVDESGEPVSGGEFDIPGIFGGEAQELAQPTANVGIATSRGTEVLSDRWVIPWLPTPSADSTVVTVTSPDEAAIEVYALVDGQLQGPFRATVAPGGRAIVPLSIPAVGAPVLVESNAPVAVEAQVVVVDQTMSVVPGIPTVAR